MSEHVYSASELDHSDRRLGMALDKRAQNGHLLTHIIRGAHPGADPEELNPHILQRRRERPATARSRL